jgi:hypothetical protein
MEESQLDRAARRTIASASQNYRIVPAGWRLDCAEHADFNIDFYLFASAA